MLLPFIYRGFRFFSPVILEPRLFMMGNGSVRRECRPHQGDDALADRLRQTGPRLDQKLQIGLNCTGFCSAERGRIL
jgi:hypothetical protein